MELEILKVAILYRIMISYFLLHKGIQEKLDYLEKNHIKSVLLQSSIFNSTGGRSLQLDGRTPHDKTIDLLRIDPLVGSDNDFQELTKILNRKGFLIK